MATPKTIESQRQGAEVYHGAAAEEKLLELLDEFSVPRNIISVSELLELGFNRSTRFFWLRQKTKTERKIRNVGTVFADVEITGVFRERHVANVTGVRGKELLVTVPVSDMLVGVPSGDKVKFKTPAGFYRVHPIAAFGHVEKKKKKKNS